MFATPHADMHLLFVQILALLVMPGVLKTFGSISKYFIIALIPGVNWDQAILIDTYSFLVLSMILTGFITVFEWDALFPDDKDIYNLTPLPIKPRTLFFAKVITLSLFVGFTNMAINGVSTVLFPGVALSASGKPSSAGIMYTAGHGISLLLSSVFVFTVAIAVRALFSLLFPGKVCARNISIHSTRFDLTASLRFFDGPSTGPDDHGKEPIDLLVAVILVSRTL